MSAGRKFIEDWGILYGITEPDAAAVIRFVNDAYNANPRASEASEAMPYIERAVADIQAGEDPGPLLEQLRLIMQLIFDARHAALLLGAMLEAVKAGEPQEVVALLRKHTGVKKLRDNILRTETVTLDSPIWNVVENLVRGKIDDAEAVKRFTKLKPMSKKQAKRYIEKLKPKVDRSVKFLDALFSGEDGGRDWP